MSPKSSATQPRRVKAEPQATPAGGTGSPAAPDAQVSARAREILARLNEPQREAVTHIKGPLLILAGAGSGKTRVLAHRVAYLVALGFKPWQIVAVTFTNKAANEMRERIAALIGEEAAREATIGTFHAICARILRRDGNAIGLSRSFTIYDRADQVALIKQVLRQLDLEEKRFSPAGMLAWIGQRKDELADVATARRQAANFYDETAARVYEAYQGQLAEDDAVDFDDLLLRVVNLFEQHADVLAKYQSRWQQVLVDEYQDTNRAQYLICRHLAATHHNLAVVGDDDQSIYSWRGADLRNILDFEADYPDARVVKLEQNYRSTQTILDAAHAVVSRNAGRKDKKLWTDRGAGTSITVFDAYNEYEEAEFVARQVERLSGGPASGSMTRLLTSRADDGDGALKYGEIAVTYRINAQSRVLEEAFMRFGIPYQLVGGTRFYERREVKDALAYVRLARNPADRVALERVVNVPARGIGEKTIEELRAWAESHGTILWAAVEAAGDNPNLATRSRIALAGFAALMRPLMDLARVEPPSVVFDAALERSGLKDAIDDGTDEGSDRWANVIELRNHAAEFDEIAPPEGLARFLEEVALVSDQDTLEDRPDRVTLITLHAAKGLEFPVVFIVGLEEGLLPHRRALEDERELEEERRLAYVGMTRAKDRLYLLHAHHRATWGVGAVSEASRFLAELPEELLATQRDEAPFRRRGGGGWSGRRGVDDGGGDWLPGGYRAPRHDPRNEPLRPVNLPDLAAGPAPSRAGRALDQARERVVSATYTGAEVDLGSGAFGGAAGHPPSAAEGELAWRAGDRVRHRRFGEGIVVSSQLVKGDEEVTVAFVGQGVKRLIAAYAGLERDPAGGGG
ncbi:MAG TPA: UvrD-helicase domain-containing protein [Candidatus Limnocylindria bacterium]|nr:UvrD-helicase domain-containing protein [Candidatus Limnocylindria bacterium]